MAVLFDVVAMIIIVVVSRYLLSAFLCRLSSVVATILFMLPHCFMLCNLLCLLV